MQPNGSWWIGDIDDPSNSSNSFTCPACNGVGLDLFYRTSIVPLNSCIMLDTMEKAKAFPTGAIQLGMCRSCGFITNVRYDENLINYSDEYEDQQGFSPTFVSFAKKVTDRLIDRYDLKNKSVLEIGCGKGDFLKMLCDRGHNRGVGIDPTAPSLGEADIDNANITYIREMFSLRHSSYVGDMIVCRHTLEHIADVRRFIKTIREAIPVSKKPVLFFELPDVVRVLADQAFWDIYYEHCSYFTPGSLANLFRSCGFELLDLYRAYDNQYLMIEAIPIEGQSTQLHQLEDTPNDTAERVREFCRKCENQFTSWHSYLTDCKAKGKRVVVWGSGSKCVSFFTTLGVSDEIEHVIDINPNRQGKYIAGACRQIKAPEFLTEYRPDVVIIMNSVYTDEITQQLTEMKLSPEIKAL